MAQLPGEVLGWLRRAYDEAGMRLGHRLVLRVRLTDAKGNPSCARIRAADVTWSDRRCG
jgi:hypothetical protein